MDWQGINEFVAVGDTESFTKAAQKLQISTAQVSRQVTALEHRLNVKLFYRTTRKVSLTEEGRTFFLRCGDILDELSAAQNALANLQTRPQGKIVLTAPVTYGEQHILPLVNDFICQYPELSVTAQLSNKQFDLVEEGFDLAIRLGKLTDSSMMAKKLAPRTNYLCASPAYLTKHGSPQNLSELMDHNCLLGTIGTWRFNVNDKEKKLRVKGNIRYNSGRALVDAALKGIGLVQLPHYYVQEHIDSGALVTLLDEYREAQDGVWALYPHNRQLSPKIRLLVDFLAEGLVQ